jgi:hypothetical protein
MKFAHKSGIDLIKLYIFVVLILPILCFGYPAWHGLRITIDKCMDIFDEDVHLYNNTGKILINTTLQPFYIDIILKEFSLVLVLLASPTESIQNYYI